MELNEAYLSLLKEPSLQDIGPNPTRFKLRRLIELEKGEATWLRVWTSSSNSFEVPVMLGRSVADLKLSIQNFGDKKVHWKYVWKHYDLVLGDIQLREGEALADQGVANEVWIIRRK
jgi:hypothetical protein